MACSNYFKKRFHVTKNERQKHLTFNIDFIYFTNHLQNYHYRAKFYKIYTDQHFLSKGIKKNSTLSHCLNDKSNQVRDLKFMMQQCLTAATSGVTLVFWSDKMNYNPRKKSTTTHELK